MSPEWQKVFAYEDAFNAGEKKYEDALRIRYFEDEAFRTLADEIHHSRMLAGAACMDCMKIADFILTTQGNEPTKLP